MNNVKSMSFEDTLKETLSKCKTIDDKFNKLIDIFCNQTRLLHITLEHLSPALQKEILTKAGFAELVMN
jgi:hypothetical protein